MLFDVPQAPVITHLYVPISATKTEDVYDCLVNLVIDVSYYDTRDKRFPCRGGHNCNNAEFGVYLDSILLGIANLNNVGCEAELPNNPKACDRTAQFRVTNDMVQKIVTNPKWNKKHNRYENYSDKHGIYWFWLNEHNKKVIVKLMGGLGNQMYQYAFAKKMSNITGRRLILDLSYLNRRDLGEFLD